MFLFAINSSSLHFGEGFFFFHRECRGLIFSDKGNILSRRFHKFFNVNELEETHESLIDINRPHILTEKMDG
jgi:RNA ligase